MAAQQGAHGQRGAEEDITQTKFWDAVMHDVFGPRKGGAIIVVDAENARKGVAKTSAADYLARCFSTAFRYDLKFGDMTLSGAEYLRRYQEHPGLEQPSVLLIDELVGAGAGDKRRSMSSQNVDLGRAWQLLRSKRVITIATLPDWGEVDRRLKKLADYRVWCREDPIGTFQAYKITTPFDGSSASSSGTATRGLNKHAASGARRIRFPNMDARGCPYYKHLSEKKEELVDSEGWDADELEADDEEEEEEQKTEDEIRREQAIKYSIRLYRPWDEDRSDAPTQGEVADAIEEYSRSWVRNRIREWRNGEHRDLVQAPTTTKT